MLSGRIVVRVVPLAAETRPSVDSRSSAQGLVLVCVGSTQRETATAALVALRAPGRARSTPARRRTAATSGSLLLVGGPRRRDVRPSDDAADASTPPTPSTDHEPLGDSGVIETWLLLRAPRRRALSHVERGDGDQSSPCCSRKQQQQQQTKACGGEVRLKLDNLDTGCSLRLLLLVRVRRAGLGPTVELSDMMCGYDKRRWLRARPSRRCTCAPAARPTASSRPPARDGRSNEPERRERRVGRRTLADAYMSVTSSLSIESASRTLSSFAATRRAISPFWQSAPSATQNLSANVAGLVEEFVSIVMSGEAAVPSPSGETSPILQLRCWAVRPCAGAPILVHVWAIECLALMVLNGAALPLRSTVAVESLVCVPWLPMNFSRSPSVSRRVSLILTLDLRRGKRLDSASRPVWSVSSLSRRALWCGERTALLRVVTPSRRRRFGRFELCWIALPCIFSSCGRATSRLDAAERTFGTFGRARRRSRRERE